MKSNLFTVSKLPLVINSVDKTKHLWTIYCTTELPMLSKRVGILVAASQVNWKNKAKVCRKLWK